MGYLDFFLGKNVRKNIASYKKCSTFAAQKKNCCNWAMV